MADYDFRGKDVGEATIAATKTFLLDPSTRYTAETSGDDGGASAVDINYQLGDGSTVAAYPDNPGEAGKSIEITTPAKGVVQVALTGATDAALQVVFRKIRR